MNEQEQIINQVIDGLIQQPEQTLQQLSQLQEQQPEALPQIAQVIVQKAQSGDQKAQQALNNEQVVQFMQNVLQPQQAQIAAKGAKLRYLNNLRGICPEGYQMTYFKAGGKVCSKCVKAEKAQKKQKQTKYMASGGATSFMNDIRTQIYAHKCGGKVKKGEEGMEMKKDPKSKFTIVDKKDLSPKKEVIPPADLKRYNAILKKNPKDRTPEENAFLQKINRTYPNATGGSN